MKRIIAILSAIIVVLFCLCACGKVNGSETTTDTGHVHTYGEWQTIKEADCVNVGDEVIVKVVEIDDQGRINLSRRDALIEIEGLVPEDNGEEAPRRPRGDRRNNHHRRNND